MTWVEEAVKDETPKLICLVANAAEVLPELVARGVVPDTFRDDYDIQVVVEGRVDEHGTFLADQIIPRCPSKYEEQAAQLRTAGS